MNINVILGMSGGVDSSVAAYILKKKGYNVIGIFMINWDEKNVSYCTVAKDLVDTQKICKFLNIKLHVVNFSFDYWQEVFFYFLNEYKIGKIPNPDIVCNSRIKFNIFLEYSKYLGADFIATGHYAMIKYIKNNYFLYKSFDLNKDQTYFLYKLRQWQLKYIIFPLYKYNKFFIRQLAVNVGLYNCMKKDSNGICFVGKADFKNFLKKYISVCYGFITNFYNKQFGIHEGIMFYTYGQKKNLNNKCFLFNLQYIVDKYLYKNELIISNKNRLYTYYCIIKDVNFINKFLFFNIKCYVKLRHSYVMEKCKLKYLTGNLFIIEFYFAQDYISSGQSVVFYKNNICFGGGIVSNVGLTFV
ncbi:MAG: tRNA 2-thiouridine(34) synthase MnmA [Candidatus Azosocius agrarius]|nr:MAG: tRNA 2-thiouridine(34) synthase MnmA [Gammaproteobacteria bacterium]